MERVVKVIANFLDIQEEDVKPTSELRDLCNDSLDLVELIILLEDEFLVDIQDEMINQLITIKDIADYMDKIAAKKTSASTGKIVAM